MIRLVEIEPGRWRIKRPEPMPARSMLPLPYVISDAMEPTEQVDGRFYSSKRAFRAVGRSLGLTEVGNDKFQPKRRATELAPVKADRRNAVRAAIEKFKAGQRSAS